MTRPVRIAFSLSAILAGAALLWAAYKASGLQVFPGTGFVMHVSPYSVLPALAGIGAAMMGLVFLLWRQPHA